MNADKFTEIASLNPFEYRALFLQESYRLGGFDRGLNPFEYRALFLRLQMRKQDVTSVSIPLNTGLYFYGTQARTLTREPSQSL